MTAKVGFIGAGQMARALANGFVRAGLIDTGRLYACDPSAEARAGFSESLPQASVHGQIADVVGPSEIIFLAVKPQHVADVFRQWSDCEVAQDKLVVSIAAGVSLERLRDGLGSDRVVRVMPNTPCLIGAGASAYALDEGVSDPDAATVGALLEAVGVAFQVPESQLDAVTGLSGSGPAFVYQMIEAMSDGGVRVGLPRPVATSLAAQTVLGAARMVLESGEHPGVLKDRVASPGGTTIAGLHALESGRLRGTVMDAVVAATERSKSLG